MLRLLRLTTLVAVCLASVVPALPARAQDLITEIQGRGVFKVGMAESPPWQAPNPRTGQYEGFNVELAERVAKVMGVKLEIVPASWSTLVPGLSSKQYDGVFANLFATPPRALLVNFTDPYATYGFHVVVPANSPVKSLEQLNDPKLTFVGVSGTVEESYPKELFPLAQVRGMVTSDVATWIGEVASGRADAAFLDPGTLRILKAKSPALERRLRLLNAEDKLLKPVGLAYAVRPEDAHMLNFLNTFIRDFVRNGDDVRLREKWFDAMAQR